MYRFFFFFGLLCPLLPAQLIITEAMAISSHPSSSGRDWWELTNVGSAAVDLDDYRWDDRRADSTQIIFPSYQIQPGESVIIYTHDETDDFRQKWDLDNTVRIFDETEFGGVAMGDLPGLSSGGDAVVLFAPDGSEIDRLTYTNPRQGISQFRFRNLPGSDPSYSEAGKDGARMAAGSPADVGSPGSSTELPADAPPEFSGAAFFLVPEGREIATSNAQVRANDPNPGDSLTFSATGLPDWLSLAADGTLSGVAPMPGRFSFQVTAQDNSAAMAATTRRTEVFVTEATCPILLNEYNAVGENFRLANGNAMDATFGNDPGNGGPWVEFVVVGDGTGGSEVDMRGWQLTIRSDLGESKLRLTQALGWQRVLAGTILTFGGAATPSSGFHLRSNLDTTGEIWSHVRFDDPALIDPETSTFTQGALGSENSYFFWERSDGSLVCGPAGEGASQALGNTISVNRAEVFALEDMNPAPTVTPFTDRYDDTGRSSFGMPNEITGGVFQDFTNYQQSSTPTSLGFLFVPPVAARGEYEAALDLPAGVSVSALNLPPFLELSGGVLRATRALTPADRGLYEVSLQAAGSPVPTIYTSRLEVIHPAPPVILNELNTVGETSFLRGGTLANDLTNGQSSDTFFGRVAGNGGNWMELVVVGKGGPGEVDLRGWKVEIGTMDLLNRFQRRDLVTFREHPYLEVVAAGTILTISDNPDLGSSIERVDNLETSGWAWSHFSSVSQVLIEATGLAIDDQRTVVRILDRSGGVVFGPAGEGIAPTSGVGEFEVVKLEATPSTQVTPFDIASSSTSGYDDASRESTFGAPNRFAFPDTDTQLPQDFSKFISTPFQRWVGRFFADPTMLATGDLDGDGATNREEYLFGTDPTSAASVPNITFANGELSATVRINENVFLEESSNLQDWAPSAARSSSDDVLNRFYYRLRTYQPNSTAPRQYYRLTE